jgi:hypothetical protein
MLQTLFYSPGQTATIFVETLDINGERVDANVDGYIGSSMPDGYQDGYIDGYHNPMVFRLVFPDLNLADNYPVHMVKLDTGLYYYQFVLPSGATAVGSYLVDISYTDPSTLYTKTSLYQISVNAPYGNYSITAG